MRRERRDGVPDNPRGSRDFSGTGNLELGLPSPALPSGPSGYADVVRWGFDVASLRTSFGLVGRI